MRRLTAAALVGICVLAVACGGHDKSSAPSSTAPMSSTPQSPVAVGVLDVLLLSAEQVNTAMSANGMTVTESHTDMTDDTAMIPMRIA